MKREAYVVPVFELKRFTCPCCHALAGQTWSPVYLNLAYEGEMELALVNPSISWVLDSLGNNDRLYWHTTRCQACELLAFWAGQELMYPQMGAEAIAEPHPSLPEDSRTLLTEAIAVFPFSRRASSALCRASLESLLRGLPLELSMPRPTLEDRINAVQKLVNPGLWKLLTAVRHVGNKSLHGADEDDTAVAMYLDETDDYVPRLLMGVVNQLAEQLIEIQNQTDQLYAAIPANVREAAERKAGRKDTGPAEH